MPNQWPLSSERPPSSSSAQFDLLPSPSPVLSSLQAEALLLRRRRPGVRSWHSETQTMDNDDDRKGFLWRLPKLQTRDWGKLGPGFGFGIGCGVGLGAGIVGGAGIGLGFPGLQVGFGAGAGCGVGVGLGYGLGKGKAHDENGTYSNIGRPTKRQAGSIAGSTGGEIGSIVTDIVSGLMRALSGNQRDNGKRP